MTADQLEQRVQTVSLVVLASIAGGAAMSWLGPALVPFVLALFISLGLSLAVDVLVERARVPRAIALPLTLVFGVAALVGIGSLVSASVAQLAQNASVYSNQLSELIVRIEGALPFDLAELFGGESGGLSQIPVSSIGSMLASTGNAIVGVLSQSMLVLIFVIFLMIGGSSGASPNGTWATIVKGVQGYLVSKIVISAATGILVGTTLMILGIPLAMTFGMLAFLLNFIPNVGSLISTLLPAPVVLMTPEISGTQAVLALGIPTAIQLLMGNVLEPKLMGDSLDLHPVAILLALIMWGMLWGIVGMFLAVPLTVVLKILLEKFEGSRPVAELLAGRMDGLQGSEREPA